MYYFITPNILVCIEEICTIVLIFLLNQVRAPHIVILGGVALKIISFAKVYFKISLHGEFKSVFLISLRINIKEVFASLAGSGAPNCAGKRRQKHKKPKIFLAALIILRLPA